MNKHFAFTCAALASAYVSNQCAAQPNINVLRERLQSVIAPHRATVGVGMINIENGDTLTINNEHYYPMQSTYKFPLALAVLHEVEQGRLALDQKVHIPAEEMRQDTWSPMQDKFGTHATDKTVDELLYYAVSGSDNIACDALFKLAGGARKGNDYIHDLGIKDIAIVGTERQMHANWMMQYNNWCKPYAMSQLLKGFYEGRYLNEQNTHQLMGYMIASTNSDKRIKGKLPADVVVAHKTGTSGFNDTGFSGACNDVAIITLSHQRHIALTVFVSDTRESLEEQERLIAMIAKEVYEYYE